MSTTFAELRRRVSRAIGDLLQSPTTALASAADRLTDQNLTTVKPDDWLNGAEALVSGTARVVKDFVADTGSPGYILLNRALAAPTASGVTVEYRNLRGRGWPKDTVDGAINDILTSGRFFQPAVDSVTITLAEATPEYGLPAGWTHIYEVAVLDDGDDNHPIIVRPHLWKPVPSRKLRVTKALRSDYDGKKLRLLGYTAHSALSAEADTTDVLPRYVIEMAAYLLLSGEAGGPQTDPDARSHRAREKLALATELERQARTKFSPNLKLVV